MDRDHQPGLPTETAVTMSAYLGGVDARLPDRICGLYLVGSVALNDYQPGQSDDVANALLGKTNPHCITWMAEKTLLMLSGKTDQLIADFYSQCQLAGISAAQSKKPDKTANYFERNLPYMDYPTYLAKGWPFASGRLTFL